MTETKTTYTAGTLTFVSEPTPDELLSKYFTTSPTGLTITGDPPQAAFDLLGANLASDQDALRWQLASWCNAYRQRYGDNAYQRAAAMIGMQRSAATIETWAWIERHVAPEARIPARLYGRATGISIYWHKHVVGLPGALQVELLEYALYAELSEAQFERYCQERKRQLGGVSEPAQPKLTAARDIIFQQMEQLGASEAQVSELRVETSQLRQQLTESATTALAWDVVKILVAC